MTNLKESGIYTIVHILSGKRYIGQAVNIYLRFNKHKTALRHNKHHSILLQRAWNKYGDEAFKFNILEIIDNPTKELLEQREQYWMDFYQSYKLETGYNLHPASSSPLGYKHTDETKIKMAIRSTGRKHSKTTLKNLSDMKKGPKNPMFGKKPHNFGKSPSDESRHKMSLSRKGKKPPPFTEEHIKHLSESKLGKNNPNFGKTFSPEDRMLIRLGSLKNTKPGRLGGCTLRKWVTAKGEIKSHWKVVIRIGSIIKYLGSFATEQEAHEAYMNAIKQI